MTPDDISRIAGRMVHRATDAKAFMIGIEGQIAYIQDRDPGRGIKLDDLQERRIRLARAIADYEMAEKIIRQFKGES